MRLTLEAPFRSLKFQFQRHRHSAQTVRLAIALYQQGLSFRQVSLALERLGQPVSHVTVWRWLQRCGQLLEGNLWRGNLPDTVVVDETILRTGWGKRYLYAAIDPKTRAVLFMSGYPQRSTWVTYDFFKEWIQSSTGPRPKRVVVDGGPWYVWPLRWLKLRRSVMRGGIRSYVERCFRYLKQRMSGLDRYFPRGKDYRSLANWLRVYVWYYNHIRKAVPLPTSLLR